MNLEFSQQIFEKYANIKFNKNPSSGSRVVRCGLRDRQTYRHDEANSSNSADASAIEGSYAYNLHIISCHA